MCKLNVLACFAQYAVASIVVAFCLEVGTRQTALTGTVGGSALTRRILSLPALDTISWRISKHRPKVCSCETITSNQL